jgi:hypothetical protein
MALARPWVVFIQVETGVDVMSYITGTGLIARFTDELLIIR